MSGPDDQAEWVARHYVAEFSLRPGRTLLDAGCGDGTWAAILHHQGFRVTGFDISEDAIARAESEHPGPDYLVADASQSLPLATFDIVFCRAISPTAYPLSDHTQTVLTNIVACLRQGGTFLFSRSSIRTGHPIISEITGRDAPQPRMSEFMAMLEQIGLDPFRATVVNSPTRGMVQIGAYK